MPYRTFAVFNITGGVVWANQTVLLGYFAGVSWRRAEHLATGLGLLLLALFTLGLGLPLLVCTLRQRLDPAVPGGPALSAALTVAALSLGMFAVLTADVLTGAGIVRLDPGVHAFAVTHRSGWLSLVLQALTWLGSTIVLIPLLAGASVLVLGRRRDLPTAAVLWIGFGGALILYKLIKSLVDRARPPATDMITHATGAAYPSGHATQAIVGWGLLALVLWGGRSARIRLVLLTLTTGVVLLVGASRIYLGAHWFTDVLAGYALGGAWLALTVALHLKWTVASTSDGQGRRETASGP